MDYASSDTTDVARPRGHAGVRYLGTGVTQSVKILVAGPFAVGKTTLIGSISEIPPLDTDAVMTQPSVGVDNLTGVGGKTRTTVGLDFGRLTLHEDLVLYVFGAPGQPRFWQYWSGLAEGAIGVLVLVDTRRLDASFDVLTYLERAGIPFAVSVNKFPDSPPDATLPRVRDALDLDPGIPVTECEALQRPSAAAALISVVDNAHRLTSAKATS